MRRSIVQLQGAAQRWLSSASALFGAFLAFIVRSAPMTAAHTLYAARHRLITQLARQRSSLQATASQFAVRLRASLVASIAASIAASMRDLQEHPHVAPTLFQTPRVPQLPPLPPAPQLGPKPESPYMKQLEEHKFRQQLERKVLTTTPDFTAGVMARLAAATAAPAATTATATLEAEPDDTAILSLPLSLSPRPAAHAEQPPDRTSLLAQASVVGCIYAVSVGIILGTILAIAVLEPDVLLNMLVGWVNWVIGLITWLGMLTRMLLGTLGLLGVAYLLMLALLAPLALLALGAPRLVTTLWRED